MRFRRRYKSGQSIVLLALVMVVLIGMVALSVDVGNAYAKQRRVQNGANAGALAGMNAVLEHQNNSKVWENVRRSLAGNNINPDGTEYTYKVEYVPKTGSPQTLATWNGSSASFVLPIANNPPSIDTLARVRVTLTERTGTYFASVVGRKTLTVTESGDACFGSFGMDVYPVGVPWDLEPRDGTGQGAERWHRIFRRQNLVPGSSGYSNLQEINPNVPGWGDWNNSFMIGKIIYLPIENNSGMPGTHISWLDWTSGGGGTSELRRAWVPPGTLQGGFTPGDVPNEYASMGPADKRTPGQLDVYDWIDGKTGTSAGVNSALSDMVNHEKMFLPMYYPGAGNGSNGAFRLFAMGHFRLVGYSFGGQEGGLPHPDGDRNAKFLMLEYLEDVTGGVANACAGAP